MDAGATGRRAAALLLAAAAPALAQTGSPPPPPARYFNDYAGVVPAADARTLDERLRKFDEETTSQVVVAVFPRLPSPSLEDFTIRAAESWRAGRKELDNGVVLFVFVQDRKMRLEVGYGLEGALPDALAGRIVDDTIAPHFRRGDYTGGLAAGIDAIMAATRGEYRAPPGARRGGGPREAGLAGLVVFGLFVLLVLWILSRHGWRTYGGGWSRGGWYGGGWSGGSWSGGGGSWGGGGGGFSGGGGSFGGGGASGSW